MIHQPVKKAKRTFQNIFFPNGGEFDGDESHGKIRKSWNKSKPIENGTACFHHIIGPCKAKAKKMQLKNPLP